MSTLLPLAWGKDKPRFNIRVGVKKATPDTNPLSMCAPCWPARELGFLQSHQHIGNSAVGRGFRPSIAGWQLHHLRVSP